MSRKDFQIKHKGHRIEPGEIEAAAFGVPGVEMCCCFYDTVKSSIVLAVKGCIKKADVLEELKRTLPSYMVPGTVYETDEIPLTANGKMDRDRLQELYYEVYHV